MFVAGRVSDRSGSFGPCSASARFSVERSGTPSLEKKSIVSLYCVSTPWKRKAPQ